MRARVGSALARGVAALALLVVVGGAAGTQTADAQYYPYSGGYGYGGYAGYGYPYSYFNTGYYSYPSSQYYGYPYFYGSPYFGYQFDPLGIATQYTGYPIYTSSSTNYSFYGTPLRGYYGYGWSSIYG